MTKTTSSPSFLAPVDKAGLDALIVKGKANPDAVRTLKSRTIAEGKFRQLNFVRNLPAHIIDEPPGLLGDDTAPNPSEATLAALRDLSLNVPFYLLSVVNVATPRGWPVVVTLRPLARDADLYGIAQADNDVTSSAMATLNALNRLLPIINNVD